MSEPNSNPLKAIRAYCIGCCGGQTSEVTICTCTNCELYPFRMGKNPFRKKRETNPETLAKMRENLARARENK